MLENEALKLDLFDARLPDLEAVMHDFNYSTVMCTCLNCEYRSRATYPLPARGSSRDTRCSFAPVWDFHLQKLGVAVCRVKWLSFVHNVDIFACCKYANIPMPYVLWAVENRNDGALYSSWCNCGWASPVLDLHDPRMHKMRLLAQWARMTPEEQKSQAYDPRELDAFLPEHEVEVVVAG